MTTRLIWTFDWSWRAPSRVTRAPVDFAETMEFDTDRESARRAHEQACQGLWVRPGWQRPYIGPLIEWELPDQEEGGKHGGLSRARRVAEIREGKELDEVPHPAAVAAHG